jgi:hypothetical protein
MRELTLALAGLTLALLLSGCESTESESARLGREGAKLVAATGTVGLGAANQVVHVGQAALVHGEGRTAVAVQLTDTGSLPQAGVPVLIDVLSAKGASLYRNNTQGIEPSLQEMPLLRPHQSAWWVDDQVLASGTPSTVKVRVGAARANNGAARTNATAAGYGAGRGTATREPHPSPSPSPPAGVSPDVQASVTDRGSNLGGPYLDGTVLNRTGVAQRNMPVFAVALRGARVVAAGRALVPALAAAGRASFRIYLVGSLAGARIELTTAPEVSP